MSVENYNIARNKALKSMTLGLIFLLFLPVGIPISLIIIPFLAGRNGARELPNNWHLTYILTVGGGWSIGLVVCLILLLSIAIGPALRVNIAETIIFIVMILFTWSSFAIGVQSSKIVNAIDNNKPYENEWKNEEKDTSELAVPEEENQDNTVSSFQKVKNFIQGNKTQENYTSEKRETKKDKKPKKAPKGGTSRVSALASRRRK
jgi:uncharacterized protein YacL